MSKLDEYTDEKIEVLENQLYARDSILEDLESYAADMIDNPETSKELREICRRILDLGKTRTVCAKEQP